MEENSTARNCRNRRRTTYTKTGTEEHEIFQKSQEDRHDALLLTINDLPTDVLIAVCSILSHKDLDTLLRVSHRLHTVVDNNATYLYNSKAIVALTVDFVSNRIVRLAYDCQRGTRRLERHHLVFKKETCFVSPDPKFSGMSLVDYMSDLCAFLQRGVDVAVTISGTLKTRSLDVMKKILDLSNALTLSKCDIRSLSRNDACQYLFYPRRSLNIDEGCRLIKSLMNHEFYQRAGFGEFKMTSPEGLNDKTLMLLTTRTDLTLCHMRYRVASSEQCRAIVQALLSSTIDSFEFSMDQRDIDMNILYRTIGGETVIVMEEELDNGIEVYYELGERTLQLLFSCSEMSYTVSISTLELAWK